MPDCPRCHQAIDSQAIACPYCRTPLKAYGHPGIPLHRATGQEPLCLSCAYHADDTCTYPQRPTALVCTMYRDQAEPIEVSQRSPLSPPFLSKAWIRRHAVWFVLVGLVAISFLLALLR